MTPAILAGIVAVRSTWLGQLWYAVPPPVWRGAGEFLERPKASAGAADAAVVTGRKENKYDHA